MKKSDDESGGLFLVAIAIVVLLICATIYAAKATNRLNTFTHEQVKVGNNYVDCINLEGNLTCNWEGYNNE